jgi:uncharacterized delta-60 repeat protein
MLVGVALVCASVLAPAPAMAAPGELDASFGNAGAATFGLSFDGRVQEDGPKTIAFAGNGAIELMGTAEGEAGGEQKMFAARLLEGGALDATFGSGGTIVTPLPPEEETAFDQRIEAGALEADGAMVGVGARVEGRLTATGEFDRSFSTELGMNAFALVELPDGQMLAAGETPTEGEGARYATLERLLPDGAPDTSFGTEGLVQLPARAGAPTRESARSIVLLPGGELLIAGIGEVVKQEEEFGWLAEVAASGSLIRSFGEEGVEYVPAAKTYNNGDKGVSVTREADGTIVLAGNTVPAGSEDRQAAAWGFLPDGAPDPSFGSDGLLLLPRPVPEADTESVAEAVDSSGYVYIGITQESVGQASYIARLTPSGTLDSTYGNDGVVSFPAVRLTAIGVDPSGRLLVGGWRGGTSGAVYLARLIGGQQSSPPATTGAPPGGTHPALVKPAAKAPLVHEHVTCARVHRGRHRGAERCTLELRHLRGTWKSALVLVEHRGHHLAERRIKRLRMPVTLVFYLPANRHPTRWTVVFRDGRKVAHSSVVVR